LEDRQLLSTFLVTTAMDNGSNTTPTAGSLRQAILNSNSTSGSNTIDFAIPGAGVHTIQPPTPLPTVTNAVLIDGYSQTGSSRNTSATADNAVLLIELNGSRAGFTDGLLITGSNVTVQGLVIDGFGSYGIAIDGSESEASNDVVQGNFIGTDPTGTTAKGNGQGGVLLNFMFASTIGGTTPAARNLISANLANASPPPLTSGIDIVGNFAERNLVEGNFIGTDASGTRPLGNTGAGVHISAGVNNTIGGTAAGAGNVIAFNVGNGVTIDTGTGNAILSNSIFGNAAPGVTTPQGIRLVNNGNHNQAAPVLTSAVTSGTTTTVQGTLTSVLSSTFTVQFFANPTADPSGFGQGQTFLGSASVLTDSTGTANFTFVSPTAVPAGQFISATATFVLPSELPTPTDTSEFSRDISVTNAVPTLTSLVPTSVPEGNPAFTLTVNGTNFVSTSTVQFAGTPLTTTFVSGMQLRASVPAALVGDTGTFPVTVVSPGPGGGTSNALNFAVTNVPPVLTNVAVTTPILEGQSATLSGSFVDPGVHDTFTLTVNWGDGSQNSVVPLAAGVRSFNVPHLYQAESPTPVPISLTLTDKDGASTSGSSAVVVIGFLDKLYCDLFHRAPDVAGFTYWHGQLAAGMTRQQVATAFLLTPEYRGIEVDQFYQGILHRKADPGGRAAGVSALLSGVSEANFVIGLVTSPEYTATHPDNASFVTGLFTDILLRTPGPAEVATWVQVLQSGLVNRAGVAQAFLSSTEAYLLAVNENFQDFLGRGVDTATALTLLPSLINGQMTSTSLSAAVLSSNEYFLRFPSMVCIMIPPGNGPSGGGGGGGFGF
jgi:hypothetical protein